MQSSHIQDFYIILLFNTYPLPMIWHVMFLIWKENYQLTCKLQFLSPTKTNPLYALMWTALDSLLEIHWNLKPVWTDIVLNKPKFLIEQRWSHLFLSLAWTILPVMPCNAEFYLLCSINSWQQVTLEYVCKLSASHPAKNTKQNNSWLKNEMDKVSYNQRYQDSFPWVYYLTIANLSNQKWELDYFAFFHFTTWNISDAEL